MTMSSSLPEFPEKVTDSFDPDDQSSESEDGHLTHGARESTHATEDDRALLEEEEEREKLLMPDNGRKGLASFFSKAAPATSKEGGQSNPLLDKNSREERSRRRQDGRRKRRRGKKVERELMYEMEEGGAKDDASSQASSSSAEIDRLTYQQRSGKSRSKVGRLRQVCISDPLTLCSVERYSISQPYLPSSSSYFVCSA